MKTDNELIAEFMGGRKEIVTYKKEGGYIEGTVLWWDLFDESGCTRYLDFDSSWDWLMPVVEKIEHEGHEVDIYKNACEINMEEGMIREVAGDKIKATYRSVVEFIKWHNANK